MSFHEWNDVMYGIEFPASPIDNEKLFAFIENHRDVIAEYVGSDNIPTTSDNIDEWVDEYEDGMGYNGISAIVGDVISEHYIETAHDEYGNEYIGMYAANIFPWQKFHLYDEWKYVTPEYIEGKIRPVIEELYGECPKFEEHTIWNCG